MAATDVSEKQAAQPEARRRGRLDPLAGWGVSVAVHGLLVLLFVQISWLVGMGVGGEGEEVGIVAEAPTATIEKGSAALTPTDAVPSSLEPPSLALETAPPQPIDSLADVSGLAGAAGGTPTAMDAIIGTEVGGGDVKADWAGVSVGGGGGESKTFEGLVRNLQRNGFDIVITFDSTGSMRGEIDEVKSKIAAIGAALLKLVPKTRIAICTYRDYGDDYVTKDLPLTSDLGTLEAFLSGIQAAGGGDEPEAIHEALKVAVAKNDFQDRARKIILLFGDAPPHREFLNECLMIARAFHDRSGGTVSTVTCRRGASAAGAAMEAPPGPRGGPGAARDLRMPQFVQIAEVGGGEAFLMTDTRQIMTQLMVLAFGSKHKDKVIEALKLTGW